VYKHVDKNWGSSLTHTFAYPQIGWASVPSARFKYLEALGRINIEGPYPPSNAIIYMHIVIIN